MSNVHALQGYGNFQDTRAIISEGSTTDFRPIDVASATDKGGTDLDVTRRAFERQNWFVLKSLQIVQDFRPTGTTTSDIFARKEDEANFEASMGDFAALDYLRTAEGQIEQRIYGLRRTARLMYRERLARRLEFLLDAMREEEDSWNDGSPESLRHMLLFLQTVPGFLYPTVTVTPSATFRVQWTPAPNKHFAVNFLPSGEVQFVVFFPNSRHRGRIQRMSGVVSWENLMNVVEPCKVHQWAANAGT